MNIQGGSGTFTSCAFTDNTSGVSSFFNYPCTIYRKKWNNGIAYITFFFFFFLLLFSASLTKYFYVHLLFLLACKYLFSYLSSFSLLCRLLLLIVLLFDVLHFYFSSSSLFYSNFIFDSSF